MCVIELPVQWIASSSQTRTIAKHEQGRRLVGPNQKGSLQTKQHMFPAQYTQTTVPRE